MKINEYYRDTAHLHLNGSIAALVPTLVIVFGNLSFIKQPEVMLFVIPFLGYSLISFQVYLYRMSQAITIKRNLTSNTNRRQLLFTARHLLVLSLNTHAPHLLLYFPDGHLAGEISRYKGKVWDKFKASKMYILYNADGRMLGFFKVKGKQRCTIHVFDHRKHLLGSLVIRRTSYRKNKKELIDRTGRYIGMIEGSSFFLDEHVLDQQALEVGRLRRGWMPLEWSPLFPEANTPVLSFNESLSEEDRLLRLSILIHEYFIER